MSGKSDDELTVHRQVFEHLSLTFDNYVTLMPLTFLLGFYIIEIVKRWGQQSECIVWPDELVDDECKNSKKPSALPFMHHLLRRG